MRRVPAGQFKARCLSLMDEVQETGEEITITKRGEPVAKLVPVRRDAAHKVWGCREGTLEILGDIVEPTGEKWNVED